MKLLGGKMNLFFVLTIICMALESRVGKALPTMGNGWDVFPVASVELDCLQISILTLEWHLLK